MRLLKRNCTTVEYRPYAGTETDINDYGQHTGEFLPEYGEPITLERVNMSAPSGLVNQTFYGREIGYTHVLMMEGSDPRISENGRIYWRGNTYEIQAVRETLNFTALALKRLDVYHPGDFP